MNLQNQKQISEEAGEFIELADLSVTDEQADIICGGDGTTASTAPTKPPGGGGFVNNHNETTTRDGEEDTACTELTLTDEELDGIKGGPLCHGVSALAWARVDGVSPLSNHTALSNHNETLAEDNASAASLADLLVQADAQIKGGPNKVGTGVLTLNGANTYLGTTSTASHGAGGGGGTGKVSVHDISITK
jgi:hypothetical protein